MHQCHICIDLNSRIPVGRESHAGSMCAYFQVDFTNMKKTQVMNIYTCVFIWLIASIIKLLLLQQVEKGPIQIQSQIVCLASVWENNLYVASVWANSLPVVSDLVKQSTG